MWRNLLVLGAVWLMACTPPVNAEPTVTEHLYTTWSTLELDSCAAAWLIKRFVDEEAQFHFVPQGEVIPLGTPFDVPGAALARTHDHTTYAAIVTAFAIQDPVVNRIAQVIHEVEINDRAGINDPLARTVDADIQQIIENASEPQAALQQSFAYFDHLYASLANAQ